MSEERTQYTAPDEVAARLGRMEAYIAQLENTIDGFNMVMGQHRATIADQTRRIVELEQEVIGYRLSAAAMKGAYIEANDEVTALKATVARLEADNRRLRHLDAMPLDAMERYFHNVSEVEEYAESREDFAAILSFLFPPVR